jgi:DNA repair protein RadC
MKTNRDILLALFTLTQQRVLAKYLPEDCTPRSIAQLDLHALAKERNFGCAGLERIEMVSELYTRWAQQAMGNSTVINSPEDVAKVMSPGLKYLDHEEFHVLCLNNAGKILDDHFLSKGIANAALVHPREVFKVAIRHTASSVILCHNHPSGVREASGEDHAITKRLVSAGKIMDIPVQDHVIICGSSYISFAESGWM